MDTNTDQPVYPDDSHEVDYGQLYLRILQPLELRWKPQEDITAYELAQCLPYLLGRHTIMPGQIGDESYFRHFEITDHNQY